MKLKPGIIVSFDGRCEEALRFYEQCLEAQVVFLLPWGDSPAAGEVPENWRSKVYHASFVIGGVTFQGGDVVPEKYTAPRGFEINLGMDDPAEAERLFGELSEGGSVRMPLQETFWAQRFGAVTDRFGISWIINCETPHP